MQRFVFQKIDSGSDKAAHQFGSGQVLPGGELRKFGIGRLIDIKTFLDHLHEYILVHIYIYVKSVSGESGDTALIVRGSHFAEATRDRLLNQARQAKNGQNDADDDETSQDDDDTEKGVEDALGGLGDFFRVAAAGDIGPGGIEETKKENGTGEEKDESNDVGDSQKFANIHTRSNFPSGWS